MRKLELTFYGTKERIKAIRFTTLVFAKNTGLDFFIKEEAVKWRVAHSAIAPKRAIARRNCGVMAK